jgi:rod shape-determining protein MreC
MALPITGARVIAYDPSLWSRCALLDQGQDHGVKRGLPVLAAGGIMGRVVETYAHYSKVMLIVDRNSGADAMVQRTRVRGILQGKGGNRCSLEYVPKSADVQVGDLVLASGLGGVYPKGMVFGKVNAANKKTQGVFQEIEVTPGVDLSALEEVVVVKVVNLALTP